MLATSAALATRRSRAVLAAWFVTLAVLAMLGRGIDERIDIAGLQLAGTDAAVEQELREEHFGPTATVPVLVHGPVSGVATELPRIVRRLRADAANRVLVPPVRQAGPGRSAVLVLVVRRLEPGRQAVDAAEPVDAAARTADPAVTSRVTGPVAVASSISRQGIEAAEQAELIAFPVLLLVLLLLFRSPLAALVPAVVGGGTVLASMGGLELLRRTGLELDAFAVNLASIMGLALGVDYSLLIVTRFRQIWGERDPLSSTPAAVGRAATLTTLGAGRTVAHAGALLVVAMLTAVVFAPGTSVLSAAVGVLVTAVVATASSLLAVPAALTLIGPHLDRWRIGGPPGDREGRMVALVMRRPRRAILLTILPLLLVSVPAVGLEANAPTSRQLPVDDPVRADVEVLRASYGVGWEAPLEITYATEETPTTSPPVLDALIASQQRILALPDVTAAIGPREVAAGLAGRAGAADPAARIERAATRAVRPSAGGPASRPVAPAAPAAPAAPPAVVGTAVSAAVDEATRVLATIEEAAAGRGAAADASRRAVDELRRGIVRLRRAAAAAGRTGRALRDRVDRLDGEGRRLREQATTLTPALRSLRDPLDDATARLRDAGLALDGTTLGRADPRFRDARAAVAAARDALTTGEAPVADRLTAAADRAGAVALGARGVADGLTAARGAAAGLARDLERLERRAAATSVALRRVVRAVEAPGADRSPPVAAAREALRELRVGVGQLRSGDGPATSTLPAATPPPDRVERARSRATPTAVRAPAPSIGADGQGHLALAAIAGGPADTRSAARVLVDPAFGGRGMRLFVAPSGGAGSIEAAGVHRRLRQELARVTDGSGLRAAVGGVGGEVIEYEDVLTHRFPVLVLALTLASFAALVLLLRCLLVPLVAVLLNLVTVAATFGALVLCFVGEDPALGGPGDIDTLALTMIFVIVFALSIDYQVFLLSRMREALGGAEGSRPAIRSALVSTGPVVTGAALIMCAVFAAFATTDSVFLRQLGVGLVFAIAVDATVVRMVLLPAILVLLGDRAWTPLGGPPARPSTAVTVQGQP